MSEISGTNYGMRRDGRRMRPASSRHCKSAVTCGLLFVAVTLLQTADAYPALVMLASPSNKALSSASQFTQFTDVREPSAVELKQLTARKRAFDRLDVSPFDFEALSKRFNDDDDLFYGQRLRAFDRLDDNAFMRLMSRKRRAFERLEDGPFMLDKRSVNYDELAGIRRVFEQSFDRLDGSTFRVAKRLAASGELLWRWDAAEGQAES